MANNNNELAGLIRHEGIRVGEIIAYRAWRVIVPGWLSRGDLLHSVAMRDYVWYPDRPASGDVRTHGIYSFRHVIRSRDEYGYDPGNSEPFLFGKVKIWGEIVEHEAGYRSEFGKIVSLDYGDPVLLNEFRRVSERMCKQVSVSLPLKGDSQDDQHDDCTGTAGSTAC